MIGELQSLYIVLQDYSFTAEKQQICMLCLHMQEWNPQSTFVYRTRGASHFNTGPVSQKTAI